MRAAMLVMALTGCGGAPTTPEAPGDTSAPEDSGTLPPTTPDPTSPTGTTGDTGAPPTLPPVNFALPGPYAVVEGGGDASPGASCRTPYRTYLPQGAPPTDATLVLAHGFSRSQDDVADLAAHVASHGVPVATLDLCHATPFDNDWDADAADLVALADGLGATRRLYAGHSAGGLRSLLAAGRDAGTRSVPTDPPAVAMLGLDLVDAFDAALDAAPSVAVPAYGLFGEASSCNAESNGLPVFAAVPDARALRVTDADHCDFEWPTDVLCTAFCDVPGDTFDDAAIRDTIHALTAAFAVWQADVDAGGADWWEVGGEPHDALAAAGAIVDLR